MNEDGKTQLEEKGPILNVSGAAVRQQVSKCLRCGECCRRSSPSLHVQDLALLRAEKIPLDRFVTLRVGEPIFSPIENKVRFLKRERIKMKEKPGSHECVYLDAQSQACKLYQHRPWQCRAQSCWDPALAQALAEQAPLSRADVLAGAAPLIEVLREHDRRCSFEKLRAAFEQLKQSQGQSIDQVLELLAFEDHFRNFIADKLSLPAGSLDFFFGRSFEDRLGLFGFQVQIEADGSKILKPLESAEKTE